MIIKNIKKNRACPNRKARRGFVILFAVTISSILLAIALGVANISLKELRFGTSAKDTNDAFFAADVGTEYALMHDQSVGSSYAPGSFTGPFVVPSLGSTSKSCAIVTVDKTSATPPTTTIISKGYNIGSGSSTCVPPPNAVEREIKTTY